MSLRGGGTPKVVSKPAPIDRTAELEASARLEAERLRKRRGMKSTILTPVDWVQTGQATKMGGGV